jgi:hypothetical protein
MPPAWVSFGGLLVGLAFALGCEGRTASAEQAPAKLGFVAGAPAARGSGPEVGTHASSLPSPSTPEEPGHGGAAQPTKPKTQTLERPQVYAKSRFIWIFPQPSFESQWIGYLWAGGSAPLTGEAPIPGAGCSGAWHRIEPRGYVCVEGTRATLDGGDPVFQAVRALGGKHDSAWPHAYAESLGLTAYTGFPYASQEPPLRLPTLPPTIHEPYPRLSPRSTVALLATPETESTRWQLTADLRWVPREKLRMYERSEFQGVHFERGAAYDLAFFRKQERPKYERGENGELSQSQHTWPRLSYVRLAKERVTQGKDTFRKVEGEPYFVREKDAVIPRLREVTPWGATVGVEDTTGRTPRGRATFVDVSVWGGWLVAYEGTYPRFVTLVSSGRGGTPIEGKEPLETASTPTGDFPVSGKFVTATMANPEVVHSAVPWTQNFNGPYALHGAYWHDRWGELKSSGCVNLSPLDAKFLFEFTEPALPEGWHGVRWLPSLEPSTMVYVLD